MKRALSMLAALALILCAAPALAENTPLAGESLTVGVTTEPSGFFFTDLWGDNITDADVRRLIHGYGLITRDADGLCRQNPTVVESMALTWLSNGDLTCEITLSPYLLWSDGQPVTARDYAFSVLLQSSPEIAALGADNSRYSRLVGWESFSLNRLSPFAGVRVNGDLNLTLTARASAVRAYDQLALFDIEPAPMGVIASGAALRDDGAGAYIADDGAGMSAETLSQTLLSPAGYVRAPSVTCGAYRLQGFDEAAGTVRLIRNPLYIGDAMGRRAGAQSLQIKTVSASQIIGQLKSGEIDIAARVSDGSAIADGLQLADTGEAISVCYSRNGLAYLAFDIGEQTTAQLSVRRALAMSIDTDRLCAEALRGYAAPVFGLYGLAGREAKALGDKLLELDIYGYDPIGAKSLLIDDGWIFNGDGAPFQEGVDELRYKMDAGRMIPFELRWAKVGDSAATSFIAEQLQKAATALGFRLQINEMGFAEALSQYERRSERVCNLFMFGESFTEPYDFSPAQGVGSRTGLHDEELERLAAELRAAADQGDYIERWFACQKRLSELLPIAPLYSGVCYDFARADVTGYAAADGWTTSVLGATGGGAD